MVTEGYRPSSPAQFFAGIPHDNRSSGKLKHLDIVVVITDGHDLFAGKTAMGGPAGQSVSLGAADVQDVDHGEIPLWIFGAEDGDSIAHAARFKSQQGFAHASHRAAEHGLDRVGHQRLLDGHNELDVLHILFEPAPDAGANLIEVFNHDRAFGLFVKSQNGVATKILHRPAEIAASLDGHQIAVKGFSAERARDGAIGADEPEIEAELPRDGQGKGVTASGDQDNFNASRVSAAQGFEVSCRDLEFRI